jgi:hypothetical protein
MYKIAAIIGGVLLMAGVALAGTVSSLGSPNSPTIGQTIPTASAHVRQEDRGVEQEPGDDRGRETEARGRANEPGEDLRDLRGPCDEAEHANDPRCTGAATAPAADDDIAEDRGGDDSSGPGSSNSGPSERSGHGGGEDDGGHSGHGGHGGDD